MLCWPWVGVEDWAAVGGGVMIRVQCSGSCHLERSLGGDGLEAGDAGDNNEQTYCGGPRAHGGIWRRVGVQQ